MWSCHAVIVPISEEPVQVAGVPRMQEASLMLMLSLWPPALTSAGNLSGSWLSAAGVILIGLYAFYKFFHISSLRNYHREVVPIKETATDALAFGVMFGLFAADRRRQGSSF